MPTTFYIIQAFCVLFPALLYFFELFKWPQTVNLWEAPSFWIATGIIVYFAGTLPLFVMQDFIFGKNKFIKEPTLYLINFIAYSIMFLFIAKAYLCPKRDTP
jgi:multisubunit Na+/H+ antiporter MnhG subunit